MLITFDSPLKNLTQKIQSTVWKNLCDIIVKVNGPIIDQEGNWICCQEKNVENRHFFDGQEEKRRRREGRWEKGKLKSREWSPIGSYVKSDWWYKCRGWGGDANIVDDERRIRILKLLSSRIKRRRKAYEWCNVFFPPSLTFSLSSVPFYFSLFKTFFQWKEPRGSIWLQGHWLESSTRRESRESSRVWWLNLKEWAKEKGSKETKEER